MVELKLMSASVPLKIINPVCLITGDGRTLESDLNEFLSSGVAHDAMCIARSYQKYPGQVLHWAMVDSQANKWWAEHLPLVNDGALPIRHTLGPCDGFDVNWDDGQDDGALWHGTSALFATLVALNLGYEKIVLAGCPMDTKGHWYYGEEFDGPDWKPEDYDIWREFAGMEQANKVRSLSGITRDILNGRL